MKKILIILALITNQVIAKPATEYVWLDINGGTSFEREFLFKELNRRAKGIVFAKYDIDDDNSKGRSFDGGIKINITRNANTCFATRRAWTYNINNERIEIPSVTINLDCVDFYSETNLVYAWINAILHEYFCHAVTQKSDHTTWGLCRPSLSTDKVYWGKKHRKYVRKNLDVPGKTGEVLGEIQFRTNDEEETLCEFGLPERMIKLYE